MRSFGYCMATKNVNSHVFGGGGVNPKKRLKKARANSGFLGGIDFFSPLNLLFPETLTNFSKIP